VLGDYWTSTVRSSFLIHAGVCSLSKIAKTRFGEASCSHSTEQPMSLIRPYVLVCLTLALFSQQIISQTQSPTRSGAPAATTRTAEAPSGQANCSYNGSYINSRGKSVPRPENCSAPPKSATAQCRDRSYSFSQSRSGTCSHHGGVAKWL
jgi:hypothetical protein